MVTRWPMPLRRVWRAFPRSWCGPPARSCNCPLRNWIPWLWDKSCWSNSSWRLAALCARKADFDLSWQLLDVASQSVRWGGSIRVSSLDLIAVQTEISNEVFATLQGMGAAEGIESVQGGPGNGAARGTPRDGSLPGPVSEKYLQARAQLSSFIVRHRRARRPGSRARAVLQRHRDRCRVCSGMDRAGHCRTAIRATRLWRTDSRDARAARLRQGVEAGSGIDRGQSLPHLHAAVPRRKESARHGIAGLLTGAANDWNVHMVAGIALRGDGMYEEALDEFSRALKLNPANAAILANHRARVYHYQNQIELAGDELEKGLALEPRHPLLRTSAGYQQMRVGNLNAAMAILERVIADDARCASPFLRWPFAMCRPARGIVPQRCSRTTPWPRPRPTARWLTGWQLTLPWKATPAKRALAAPRHLSRQRKLSVVPEESRVE